MKRWNRDEVRDGKTEDFGEDKSYVKGRRMGSEGVEEGQSFFGKGDRVMEVIN